jgi:hypothetical protein
MRQGFAVPVIGVLESGPAICCTPRRFAPSRKRRHRRQRCCASRRRPRLWFPAPCRTGGRFRTLPCPYSARRSNRDGNSPLREWSRRFRNGRPRCQWPAECLSSPVAYALLPAVLALMPTRLSSEDQGSSLTLRAQNQQPTSQFLEIRIQGVVIRPTSAVPGYVSPSVHKKISAPPARTGQNPK